MGIRYKKQIHATAQAQVGSQAHVSWLLASRQCQSRICLEPLKETLVVTEWDIICSHTPGQKSTSDVLFEFVKKTTTNTTAKTMHLCLSTRVD